MANKHYFRQLGQMIDHTPAAEVSAGKMIRIGGVAVIAPDLIAASKLGAVATSGVFEMPYVGGVRKAGQNVWWDANGTPYGGSADGACTCAAASAGVAGEGDDFWCGTLVEDAALTDATCMVALNKVNPEVPAWADRQHFTTAVDLTFVAATHSGAVFRITVTTKKAILPVGVVGMELIVVNDITDGGLASLDLNGNEIIEGALLTIAATEQANNTALTAKQGDYLHVVCNVAATSWRCIGKRGIWVTS